MSGNFEITDEILSQARKAASSHNLCPSCMGRLFGKLGHGLTNWERGNAVYRKLGADPRDEKCWLCEGTIGEIPKFSDMVVGEISKWDFSTYLVGSKVEAELQAREEELWVEAGAQHPEAIKSEFNREIGKLVEAKTGKKAEFGAPDIVAIVDTRYYFVTLQIASLFIYGRYKKLIRGIPQTRWPCWQCMGKGCDHCGGKGKMYETSVEELVAVEVMKATSGGEHAFHGMGREDIDARMLGNGRPFVLEIKNPKTRKLDLGEMERKINGFAAEKVEVSSLRLSSSREVERLKAAEFSKTYNVKVRIPGWRDGREKLKKEVSVFGGLQVSQQTPTRVAHRRADLVRKRKVLALELLDWDEAGKLAEFSITAESGTYIKELVTGDGGRTIPSVSEKTGANCEVAELDVVKVHDE